jgi:hypothetical protein
MTDLAIIDDHTEQALGLLISQYRDKPRLSGLITAITNRLQEFEDCNWDVINKRLLDYIDRDGNLAHAVGAQLDTIGRIVGQGRGGQDDATYLIYIRAKIFLNKSRAKHDDVIKLLQLVEAADFTYSEYYPCTVWIEFTEPTAADPAVLVELARRAVTGGVQLFLANPTGDDDALILGDSSIPAGTPDAVHGLGDAAATMGGHLAEIW